MQTNDPPYASEPIRPGTATPPTLAGPLLIPRPRSKWPMAVGVIAIVVGSLGILMNACGILSMLLMSTMFSKIPAANMAATMPPELMQMSPEMLASVAVRGMLSVLLLAIGIGIVQRRPWSARVARSWAIVAIVACLLAAVADYRMQERNLRIMANNPAMPMPMQQGLFSGFMMIQVFFWFAARSALPVFFLIWFGRPRIREEVVSWRSTSAEVGQVADR